MTTSFKQFLSEQETRDLIEFLQKNCKQACDDMIDLNGVLWRGLDNDATQHDIFTWDNGPDVKGFIGHPRSDRTPRDTPGWAHDIFNGHFKKQFGSPLRSTAVFTSTRRDVAMAFGGAVYAVIPIGDYTVYWSPKIHDLTSAVFKDGTDEIVGGDAHWQQKGNAPSQAEQEEYVKHFMETAGYIEGDLKNAFKSNIEIMLKCNSYLALLVSPTELDDILNAVLA